jgi:uncharacterized repeat protein (TIGR01451 family)
MRRGALIGLVAAALLAGAPPTHALGFGFITSWGGPGEAPGRFGEASDVAVGGDFDVYVADRFNDRIQVFSPLGAFRRAWGTPESFGVDVAGDAVVLSEFGGSGVSRYATGGAFQTRWGTLGGTGDPQPRYSEPWGVDVGADGLVYVADSINGRIVVTTRDGAFVRSMGDGLLSSPFGVAADPAGSGSAWVADTGNGRIVRVDPGGTFHVMGGPGSGDGQYSTPWDIAFDPDGDLLVTDRGNHRIQRISRGGTFLAKFGSLGGGPGQLSSPQGLGVDAAGNVYVADVGNSRVVRFGDRASLSATVAASRGAMTAGEEVAFTVRVANAGPDAARLVGARLTLPGNAAPVSAVATQGGCGGAAPTSCALGTIPAGGAAAAVFTVRATAAGTLPVAGTATSPTFDADVTDDAAAAAVTVAEAPVAPAAVPSLALSAPRVTAAWRRSRVRGRVRVAIATPRPARIRLELLAGAAARARLAGRTVALPRAGRFLVVLALPPRTAPGRHTLRAREIGVPPADRLAPASLRVRLAAPAEGVVARAFVSRGVGGRGVARIRGRAPNFLFANFRFSATPRDARKLRVAWSWSGRDGVVARSRVRPVRGLAVSPLRSRTGGLPPGRYRAVLSYGRTVVAVASVRLG